MATSFALALNVVIPRLKLNQPHSRFFFAHIAEKHGATFDAAAKDLINLSDEKVLHELGTQVAVNSLICQIKAKRCRKSLEATAFALAFYLISLIPLSISAYEKERSKPLIPQQCFSIPSK
jgi:hypothetical protein